MICHQEQLLKRNQVRRENNNSVLRVMILVTLNFMEVHMKTTNSTKPTACSQCKYRKRGLTRLFSSSFRCSISTRDSETGMQLRILPAKDFIHAKCPLNHPRHLARKYHGKL